MSAPTENDQIQRMVEKIHGDLKSELGNGVTLQNVRDKLFELHGLDLPVNQVAKFLSASMQAKRQGISSTSTDAGIASDEAATASADAGERATIQSHATASIAHRDAADAHAKASAYHEKAAQWHDAKCEGKEPTELEGEQ